MVSKQKQSHEVQTGHVRYIKAMEKSMSDSIVVPHHILENMLATMVRIRCFEESVADLASKREVNTPVHLSIGQEAIAAGVCQNLSSDDYVFSTHRNHGHYIAKGGNLNKLMAEIFGKETGCSFGHGGSMHTIDPDVGFMGSSAIVAGTVPIAVGAALSAKRKGKKQISVAFFGDGATDEGVFYESINLAALYNLPIVFVCENNLFSTHMPIFKRQKNIELFKKVKGFGIITEKADGNNPIEVYSAAKKLIQATKDNNGPVFLECMTYRWLAHVGPEPDIDIGYRRKEDIEYWKGKCPIKLLRNHLISINCLDTARYSEIEKKMRGEVDAAVTFAKNSKLPNDRPLGAGLFCNKGLLP
jgi:pyruvate dehydrogenase E1 component alpha subunit